jgi:DNA-binding NarL/FixJ family response regulator
LDDIGDSAGSMAFRIRLPRGRIPHPFAFGDCVDSTRYPAGERPKRYGLTTGALDAITKVLNHKFTTEEELVLKSLAAGLKAREIEDMLLDPEDASVAVYIESALSKLGLSTKRELLQYVRARYTE